MPTNAELIAKCHEQPTEGGETAVLVQAVADKQGEIKTELATVKAALTDSQSREMTATEREEAMTALTNATDIANTVQQALTALVTPPAEPLPPVEPEPPVDPNAPVASARGRKR